MGCGVGKAMMQHAKEAFSNSQAESMTVISEGRYASFVDLQT